MKLVRNTGKRNHRAVIASLLKSSDRAVLCAGWLKVDGIALLLPAVERALSRGAAITIYSSEKETRPEAIAALSERAGLRHYIVPHSRKYLHSKLYYFEQGAKYTALVGSANMTYGGLVKNEELSISFSGLLGDSRHGELAAYMSDLQALGREARPVA